MKTTDEKLQESIERGTSDSTDLDSRAYKIVFDALHKTPVVEFSSQFADQIIRAIIRTDEKRAIKRDYIWLGMGVVTLLIASGITIVLTDFKLNAGAFTFISNYSGLLIFSGLLIILFHWIEKKTLPRKSVV